MSSSLQDLEMTFEGIIRLSDQMLKVMEQQMEAIVSARREEIERCTEEYVDLKGQLKDKEKRFTDELRKNLGSEENKDPVKLDALKGIFPESSKTIDQWKSELRDKTKKLQETDEKLIKLLKFAMAQNQEFMQNIYSMSNRKNIHYSSSGGKEDFSSGIAINQEV